MQRLDKDPNIEILCLDEIGRMQVFAENFLPTVDLILDSDKPVLATIVYDDEEWARKYKDPSKYYCITVTQENREQLPILITEMLNKATLIAAQSHMVQQKILHLFNYLLTNNKIPELLKLFKHTVLYVANQSIKSIEASNSYLINGLHGNYIVTKDQNNYSCTCKFYAEELHKECSHILAVQILTDNVRPSFSANNKLKYTV